MRPPRSRPDATVVRAAVRQAAPLAGGLVVLAGLTGFYGGWRDLEALTSIFSGWPTLKPSGAALLMLCGASLVLAGRVAPSRRAIWASRLCAASALLLAGATLLEYATSVDLGIDHLLVRGCHLATGRFNGRASPQTATSSLLAGAALLMLERRGNGGASPTQVLALVAGSIPAVGLLGYAFDVPELYRVPPHPSSGMAVLSATALLLLSTGILAARPDVGPVALLTSSHAGGVTARRLLLGLLAFLPVVFLIVLGQRLGFYDEAGVSALLAFFAFSEAVAVILLTCSRLDLDDREHRDGEERAHEDERRRLADETARRVWLMSIIDQMPEGVILLNDKGGIEAMNQAVLSLASSDANAFDVAGMPAMFEVRRSDGSPVSSEDYLVTRALTRGEVTTDQEMQVRLRDGRLVPIMGSAAPVRDAGGRITGAVAVVRDITTRKELERLREEWASIIAHDLRQPVAAIALTAESLLGPRNAGLSDLERRAVERIRAASQRLARMIEDLLDSSRIEAKRMSVQRRDVDFCTIIQMVVESRRETNAIRLEGEPGLRVSVDPDRIHQVLDNLISNAVKYGRHGAEIRIEWLDRNQQLEVVVTNQGAGIPAEELPQLFSRFGRTRDARTHRTPGIGLGLYIARGLVEAHGGRIWAESVPGQSTSFHFTLPMAAHHDHLPSSGAGAHAPA